MEPNVRIGDDSEQPLSTAKSALILDLDLPVRCQNAGLFVSRGQGTHPARTIGSYELIFVRHGVLEIEENGVEYAIGPGKSFLLFPNVPHSGTAPYPPNLAYYWIHFTVTGGSDRPVEDVLSIPKLARVARPDSLVSLFHRFLEAQESGTLSKISSDLMLLLMLQEASSRVPEQDTPESAGLMLANRADAYIRTHFHREISTADIAEHYGCSADYLGRAFKNAYGISVIEYIHRRRMRHACLLLVSGDGNVTEIAHACGFSDVGYFRRLFRRHQGLTPLRYRRLHGRAHVNTE
jgi:AraC-like DNA-binding protein